MNKKLFILVAAIIILASLAFLFIKRDPAQAVASPVESDAHATIADLQIRRAETIIRLSPSQPDGYNLLALAYIQKARETGDFSFNLRAEAALKRSMEIAPDNFDALKLQAVFLIASHRFSEALDWARRAQAIEPESPDIYGAMTDAMIELGDYQEAFDAAQRMIDLRPDSASFARASFVRALNGRIAGAIEAMRVAIRAAPTRDAESLAWLRVQMGKLLMSAGKLKEAEEQFDLALEAFPSHHLALAAKARARQAAGDLQAAIDFYEKSQERAPLADTATALGDLHAKLNHRDEAKRQYELVELIENPSSNASDLRQLALFWADRDTRLDEALEIARRARSKQSDIYTCDLLAWCLFKKGALAQARAAIIEAMRLGTKDARIYYHAGMIFDSLGESQKARKYLKAALDINATFDNSNSSFGPLQRDIILRTLEAGRASRD
ncbi:MAG: tetratricopeptide repeat protein [Acidobacteriota bacterium]